MSAHPQRLRYLTLGIAVAIIGLVGMIGGGTARAAPAGAAQNLSVYQQQCTSNGMVEVTFVWTPSGQGSQWFDITRLPNFSAFGNKGPLAVPAYYTSWTLDSNTTFFARVNTLTPQGFRTSDVLQFQTRTCPGAFTAPHDVNAQVFDDFVRISWQAGNGNLFYCVDTGFTQSDVENVQGSWHNWGCGTTATHLDLTSLACERDHYARVWAAGNGTSGYSETIHFVSQDCNFSPPTNPSASVRSNNTIRFHWDRGNNNLFFCIDLALNQSDLRTTSGTWTNAACGTTGETADVTGLVCDTFYYYRIWAAGTSTSGYSPIESFSTPACPFTPPDNLHSTTSAGPPSTVQWTWDASDPAATYYCVDYAETEADLTGYGDTWHNACTTGKVTQVAGLDPGTYYWRVFAYAGNVNGYSDVEQFTIPEP
jgi:hypothetical protein